MKYTNMFESEKIKSKVLKVSDEDDEDESFGSVKLFNKPKTINEVDAYIDGGIRSSYYYRNLLQYLRQMEKEDICRIWLNTHGGDFDSTKEIIGAMHQSEGLVTVIISGSAYSGGSMIALCAPQLIVSDNATMMIHTASFGVKGKVPDLFSMVEFGKKEVETFVRNVYEGFLSKEEIDDVLDGKEMWFTSDDIVKRLKFRAEYQKSEVKSTNQVPKVVKSAKIKKV